MRVASARSLHRFIALFLLRSRCLLRRLVHYDSYGAMLAAKSVDPGASPWPGTWAPKQVLAGWQGTNLAAYETDFYHNIVSVTPELRQVFGAGEEFLGGIDKACALKRSAYLRMFFDD